MFSLSYMTRLNIMGVYSVSWTRTPFRLGVKMCQRQLDHILSLYMHFNVLSTCEHCVKHFELRLHMKVCYINTLALSKYV